MMGAHGVVHRLPNAIVANTKGTPKGCVSHFDFFLEDNTNTPSTMLSNKADCRAAVC